MNHKYIQASRSRSEITAVSARAKSKRSQERESRHATSSNGWNNISGNMQRRIVGPSFGSVQLLYIRSIRPQSTVQSTVPGTRISDT